MNNKYTLIFTALIFLLIGGVSVAYLGNQSQGMSQKEDPAIEQSDDYGFNVVVDDLSNGNETDEVDGDESSHGSSIKLIDTKKCGKSICHELSVSCEGLKNWPVEVRESEVSSPRGAIIFGTGGPGTSFYFDNPARKDTRLTVQNENLEFFEFKWGRPWFAAGEITQNIRDSHCVYAETVKWIEDNRVDNTKTMCAQGNSGGSVQISYGLSHYGLEDVFDMVILTGGPPLTRMDIGCFGDPDIKDDSEYVFRPDQSGRRWIDVGMGFESEQYCESGSAPDSIINKYKNASIVSSSGDYTYPNTKVNFVNSKEDIPGLRQIMYDEITTDKDIYWIPGDEHGIDTMKEGKEIIQDLIVNECK